MPDPYSLPGVPTQPSPPGQPAGAPPTPTPGQSDWRTAEPRQATVATSTATTSAVPSATTLTPKSKSNGTLMIVMLLIGILIGGAAGYFIGYFLIFQPRQTELQQQVTMLQSEISQLRSTTTTPGTGTGTGTGTTGTGTTTGGTGTAPTTGGVTADPQTANWATYTNTDVHFSFKYPAADYEVRTFQTAAELETLDNDGVIFAAGLFKPGETEAAGFVYVYDTPDNDGPSLNTIRSDRWVSTLPTPVKQRSAGAGKVHDISESSVTVNGSEGTKIGALEVAKFGDTEPAIGGDSYYAYLFENQFEQNYLVASCSSDIASQRAQVGCLFLTTFQFLR